MASNIKTKSAILQLQRIDKNSTATSKDTKIRRNPVKEVSVLEQAQMLLDYIDGDDSKLHLKVLNIEGKGRGVFTTEIIPKNQFVCEYAGELLSGAEAKKKENIYEKNGSGSYIYYFKFHDKRFCIDATEESGRLGRLINHSKKDANLRTMVVVYQDNPTLVFFSTRIIF